MTDASQTRREKLSSEHPRYRHWEVFLVLEQDLETISRYITIHADNYAAYSIECATMIMRCCSEIEKLNKRIAGSQHDHFPQFMPKIIKLFPELTDFQGNFLRWEVSFTPWKDLHGDSSTVTDWWTSYNDIKHDKGQANKAGNLGACLNAVSALYISTLYYERFLWARTTEDGSQYVSLPLSLEPRLITPYSDFSTDHRSLWGNQFVYTWKDSHDQTAP